MEKAEIRSIRAATGRFLAALGMGLLLTAALYRPAAAIFVKPDVQPYIKLFGTNETRSQRVDIFPKWRGMLERYFEEVKLADAPCESSLFNRCQLKDWTAFLRGLRGKDRMEQIREVNTMMNRRRYILDIRNYGVPDYWASPLEFFTRNGDCEDYAITKFMSLRALGFDNADMRIVVLNDLNLGIAHAVLVVYFEGRILMLDNQVADVVSTDTIRHYRPIYSINEQFWWLHTT